MADAVTVSKTFRIKKTIYDKLTPALLARGNCMTKNDFVCNAIELYINFLYAKDMTPYISDTILAEMQGKLNMSDSRMENALFKLAVLIYVDIYVRVAEGYLTEESFNSVLKKSIDDVKGLNGFIDFNAMFQSIQW